jgi:hypothetical protein
VQYRKVKKASSLALRYGKVLDYKLLNQEIRVSFNLSLAFAKYRFNYRVANIRFLK